MSETTYYKRSRKKNWIEQMIITKLTKKRREKARNKYRELSEEENIKREYGRNRYEENKLK